MNHRVTTEEAIVLQSIDFVIPLKQVGIITRAVLEGVHSFYNPRRIIVVTPAKEKTLLLYYAKNWDIGRLECVEEETFFQKNFNLSIDDIIRVYDHEREGDKREPGWWIQQLIKLGAGTQIEGLSEHYVVWDGDLIPLRRWKICDVDLFGNIRYYVAILQGESRSQFNAKEYAKCMAACTNLSPVEPQGGGTYVSHHMVFRKQYVSELLSLICSTLKSTTCWPVTIMSLSRRYYRFSEYKIYCSFMRQYHSHDLHFHEFSQFGDGLRYRDSNNIIEEILKFRPVSSSGITYLQMYEFIMANDSFLDKKSAYPGYIQLDHVYGLSNGSVRHIEVSRLRSKSKLRSKRLSFSSIIVSGVYVLRVFSMWPAAIRATKESKKEDTLEQVHQIVMVP